MGPARGILDEIEWGRMHEGMMLRTGNVRIDGFALLIKCSWCCTSFTSRIEVLLAPVLLARQLPDSRYITFSTPTEDGNSTHLTPTPLWMSPRSEVYFKYVICPTKSRSGKADEEQSALRWKCTKVSAGGKARLWVFRAANPVSALTEGRPNNASTNTVP